MKKGKRKRLKNYVGMGVAWWTKKPDDPNYPLMDKHTGIVIAQATILTVRILDKHLGDHDTIVDINVTDVVVDPQPNEEA